MWRWGLAVAILTAGLGSVFLLSPPAPENVADRLLLPMTLTGDAPVKIVFLGTSLTLGDPWPDLVAARLENCVRHPIQASRFAEGGATSAWGLTQLETVITKAPDLIVLEFAINDADLRRGLSLRASQTNHRAIISRLREGLPKARIILMTTNPASGLRRLLRPRLAAYYALYHTLADEMDTGLVDLYPRWQAQPTIAQDLADGVHPTAHSAAVVIVPVVTAYLAQLLGQACTP